MFSKDLGVKINESTVQCCKKAYQEETDGQNMNIDELPPMAGQLLLVKEWIQLFRIIY